MTGFYAFRDVFAGLKDSSLRSLKPGELVGETQRCREVDGEWNVVFEAFLVFCGVFLVVFLGLTSSVVQLYLFFLVGFP